MGLSPAVAGYSSTYKMLNQWLRPWRWGRRNR